MIRDLKKKADHAWERHFETCSNNKVWAQLDATLTDIKAFELSWKLRWIEKELDKQTSGI